MVHEGVVLFFTNPLGDPVRREAALCGDSWRRSGSSEPNGRLDGDAATPRMVCGSTSRWVGWTAQCSTLPRVCEWHCVA